MISGAPRRPGASRSARARDRDHVAEHAESRELRSGTRPGDRDLADRIGAADHGVRRALDVRERIVGADELGLHARADRSRPAGLRELERRDVLDALPERSRALELRAGDAGDAAARDLVAPQLPAEHERRQDHHLRDGVVAVDVGAGITLGEAGPLCLRERLLVGRARRHPREDEVGGRVEQAAQAQRDRAREPVDERAEQRRARHDGRFGAERDTAAARELRELDAVQGDRPLVRRDHRDAAPERLAHVREPGLAVGRRARRHLHEQVGIRRAQPLDRARPAAHAGQLGDRAAAGDLRERGAEIEPVPS